MFEFFRFEYAQPVHAAVPWYHRIDRQVFQTNNLPMGIPNHGFYCVCVIEGFF
jgi:hypothetical protein